MHGINSLHSKKMHNEGGNNMNSRIFGLIYGGLSYLIFFLTFNYAILFIGNIFVPVGLDSLPADGSIAFAIGVNIILISLFGIQHSVMARPWFKRWLTRYIPQHLERSTYVLVSTVFFFPLIFCWQPNACPFSRSLCSFVR